MKSEGLSELKLEGSFLALWNEFLGGYFDGNQHAVGANEPVTFPKAVLSFQQGAIPQPLKGASISLIWISPSRITRRWETVDGTRQQMAYAKANWIFLVRAEVSGKGVAKQLVTTVSDLLFGLVGNSGATRPLAQKGIHHLRAESPVVVADTSYSLRKVSCRGTLRFAIRSQGYPPPVGGAARADNAAKGADSDRETADEG